MGHYLRIATVAGCAILASPIIYAANSTNEKSSTTTIQNQIQHHLKPSKSFLQGSDAVDQHDNDKKICCSTIPKYSTSRLQQSIEKARELCDRVRVEHGLPGLVIGVTVNGKSIWDEGFGYADVENKVKMQSYAIMRIASISKPMTMAMMAKLMEEDKIDIDLPIQRYLPNFPQKTVDGHNVTITTRHLLSHLSGIRHYKKKEEIEEAKKKKKGGSDAKRKGENEEVEKKKGENEAKKDDISAKEYYIKDNFDSIEKALKLFQDDELLHAPGIKYSYSTHAWTVVSAIIEKITETQFDKHAKQMFQFWGLKNTFLDEHEPLIYNRTRYYSKNKHGRLINSPYVDNSYKWSGGGFLSNVNDLTQFVNMLLFSLQHQGDQDIICDKALPKNPYLKTSTVQKLWTGDSRTRVKTNPDYLYGLGFVIGDIMRNCMFCKERDMVTVYHSGGAVGASSTLVLIFPKNFQFGTDVVDLKTNNTACDTLTKEDEFVIKEMQAGEVKGVAVAMITNLTDVPLTKTANEIANLFKWLI